MKKLLFFIFIIPVLFSACTPNAGRDTAANTKPDSTLLHQSKAYLQMSVLWYQRSAEMRACYYQTYNFAKILLDKHLAKANKKKKKAVIVDIDETILDNSPFSAKSAHTGFDYTPELWKQWTVLAKAEALPGSVEFLNYAKQKGVEVFYISNRDLDELNATKANLIAKKFPYIDSLHMLFKDKKSDKTERRNIVAANYEILLLIGDNLRDFDEIFGNRKEDFGFGVVDANKDKFGDRFLILPNPLYGEWEKPFLRTKNNESDFKLDSIRKSAMIVGY